MKSNASRDRRIIAIVMCLVAILMWLPDGNARPPDGRFFDQVLAEAIEARKAGDFSRTIALLKEAYSIRPNPALLNNIGTMYRELGHYADALRFFDQLHTDRRAGKKLRSKAARDRAAMEAKLGRAWLRIAMNPSGATVYVNGKLWERPTDDEEIGLQPGGHVLEVTHPHFAHVYLLYVQLTLDRRTATDIDLSQLLSVGGQVSLIGHRRGIQALSISDYVLRSDLQSKQGVCLPAGSYRVRVTQNDRRSPEASVLLGSGNRVPLGTLVQTDASRSETGASSGPWSYVVMGTGLVAAGAGTWLLIDAGGREDELTGQLGQKNGAATVTGITEVQAGRDQDAIDTRYLWGTVSVVTGGALLAGGLAWWLLDWLDDEPEDRSVQVQLHPTGLSIEGRF